MKQIISVEIDDDNDEMCSHSCAYLHDVPTSNCRMCTLFGEELPGVSGLSIRCTVCINSATDEVTQ